MYNVGIIGYGILGKAVKELFPKAKLYDPVLQSTKLMFNSNLDYAFICVPTPQLSSGRCDTSIVEDSIRWATPKKTFICLSTVEIGTTEIFARKYRKPLVFQPEYFGEGVDHPLRDLRKQPFIILGGEKKYRNKAIELYQTVYNSNIKIFQTDSTTAETIKYMENAWLATKVTFFNEIYDICKELGVNYNEAREGFLLDPRVNPSHTFVYPEKRGWHGKCLPKDTAAFCHTAKGVGKAFALLEKVREINESFNTD